MQSVLGTQPVRRAPELAQQERAELAPRVPGPGLLARPGRLAPEPLAVLEQA